MKLILAPMEGVIDHNMRKLLTGIGGYDRCVTEFIRVTTNPVPAKVFNRLCPELASDGHTASGVPVFVQLLGGDPELMAKSAEVAIANGAPGIDLNFGCPAKVVNRHGGGSILLRDPHRIGIIVKAVRDRTPPSVPVCAKIRLGFNNSELLPDIVDQIGAASANELCIHARTRIDGYKPPAYWSHIGEINPPNNLRLIVNGEIWNVEHAVSARQQSGCPDLMVGRGGLACPDLAKIIHSGVNQIVNKYQPLDWPQIAAMVNTLFNHHDSQRAKYAGNRTKQWLAYLRKRYQGAEILFHQIKRLSDADSISKMITKHRHQLDHEYKI